MFEHLRQSKREEKTHKIKKSDGKFHVVKNRVCVCLCAVGEWIFRSPVLVFANSRNFNFQFSCIFQIFRVYRLFEFSTHLISCWNEGEQQLANFQ